MAFRIRQDARDWFRYIKADLVAPSGTPSAPDFDAFYFCFIAGISKSRKGPAKNDQSASNTAELVNNFPGPYRSRGRFLVSLFLCTELESLGVRLDNKKTVRSAVANLVNPAAQNYLSDEGTREFNKYAYGGFDVLLDWFDYDHPRTLESFVCSFRLKIIENA